MVEILNNMDVYLHCRIVKGLHSIQTTSFHQPENSKKFQALFFYVAKMNLSITEATGKTITGHGDLQKFSENWLRMETLPLVPVMDWTDSDSNITATMVSSI